MEKALSELRELTTESQQHPFPQSHLVPDEDFATTDVALMVFCVILYICSGPQLDREPFVGRASSRPGMAVSCPSSLICLVHHSALHTVSSINDHLPIKGCFFHNLEMVSTVQSASRQTGMP